MHKPKRDRMTLPEKFFIFVCLLILALFIAVFIWAVITHPIPASAIDFQNPRIS